MNKERFIHFFDLYLKGKATNEQWEELMQMIKSGLYDDYLKEEIDLTLQSKLPINNIPDEKSGEILQHILSSEKHTARLLSIPPKRSISKFYWAAAAAACLVVLVFVSKMWLSSSRQQNTLAVKPQNENTIYPTTPGKKFLRLPDGSTVILNEGSTLEYPDKFTTGKRIVKLKGEGYFDIKHDETAPFIVYTGKVKTTVLGTAFNIKTDAQLEKVVITVTRGKVKVGDENREYGILTPNQQLDVDTHENTFVTQTVNLASVLEWKKEYLVLDDVSLEEVSVLLEQKFNIKILLVNEGLKKCRVSATFLNNESLEQVMAVTCGVINASYSIQPNDQVTINGIGCN
jgi:transmembrane sensor